MSPKLTDFGSIKDLLLGSQSRVETQPGHAGLGGSARSGSHGGALRTSSPAGGTGKLRQPGRGTEASRPRRFTPPGPTIEAGLLLRGAEDRFWRLPESTARRASDPKEPAFHAPGSNLGQHRHRLSFAERKMRRLSCSR